MAAFATQTLGIIKDFREKDQFNGIMKKQAKKVYTKISYQFTVKNMLFDTIQIKFIF